MNEADKTPPSLYPEPDPEDLSSYRERQTIGYIGMLLPILIWLIEAVRPLSGYVRWMPLGSISAYYYTAAGSVFVGGLVLLSVKLFAYQGYQNTLGRWDRFISNLAGLAALLVAGFPTGAPENITAPTWWIGPFAVVHYSSAIVLLCGFMLFCLKLFPQTKSDQGPPSPDKKCRNRIYYACGVLIAVGLAWAGIALYFLHAPIFMPETVALEAFALSWLVKGRADQTIIALPELAKHYSHHPQQLVNNVKARITGRHYVKRSVVQGEEN